MEKVTVSLLDSHGEVQYGLNWGDRDNRDKNQAYLQLTPDIWKNDFFPIRGKYFIVDTDDLKTLIFTRAQKNEYGTALQTPENNAILGLYIRERLGIPSGEPITLEAIQRYGRSTIDFYKVDNLHYIMSFSDFVPSESSHRLKVLERDEPLQQIFYGAPGTGKSRKIKDSTNDDNAVRTTFHPDTDYSSFVGAYKPTTREVEVRNYPVGLICEGGVSDFTEPRIVYEFVMQAFLQAYEKAWKKFIDAGENGTPERQYLIIEEINRGNCAQIFGDLFQLLDRNDYGFSDYPIVTDADLEKQLRKMFARLGEIPGASGLNEMYNGANVMQRVQQGKAMVLPKNLYIWATMNTSDQSLFPIDSAFKRRWDWKYMPISDAGLGWQIEANNNRYDWWEFLKAINCKIEATTSSEDKQLGYFFVKAKNGVISAEKFVGKVIFYLWNDVFKDFELADAIFEDDEEDENNSKRLTFRKFYYPGDSAINPAKVEIFLANLKVNKLPDATQSPSAMSEEDV